MLRPVMQRGGVKIRTVRPNQGVSIGIDLDAAKQFQISQRSEEFAREDWTEIDNSLHSVVELNAQRVIGNDFERNNSANRMFHGILSQRRDRNRSSTRLQPLPIRPQLSLVQLSPSLQNETPAGAKIGRASCRE